MPRREVARRQRQRATPASEAASPRLNAAITPPAALDFIPLAEETGLIVQKVDKSFVDGVNEGGEESALTPAIIELAAILNLRLVAEGIERADQLEKLLELNCEFGQGFHFSRPLPIEGIDGLLDARRVLAGRDAALSS